MFGLAVILLVYVTIHTVTEFLSASATTVQWLEHGSKLCLGLMGLMLTYIEFSGAVEDIAKYKNSLELFQRAENKLDKPFGDSGVFPSEIKQEGSRIFLQALGNK